MKWNLRESVCETKDPKSKTVCMNNFNVQSSFNLIPIDQKKI